MKTARERPLPGTWPKCWGLPVDTTKRIVFHEITKPAILAAIESPRTIDMNLVNAQQARRVLDRLVGFELSPLLWKKVRPQLSAGRVQSVAVRLLVEREREIIAFKSTPYFRVVAPVLPHGRPRQDPLQGRAVDPIQHQGGGRSFPALGHRGRIQGRQGRGETGPALPPRPPSPPRPFSRKPAASTACPYRRPCRWRSTSTSRD